MLLFVNAIRDDGRQEGFTSSYNAAGHAWVPTDPSNHDSLVQNFDQNSNVVGWTLFSAQDLNKEIYNASGKLIKIVNKSGQSINFTYTQVNDPSEGVVDSALETITGVSGRVIVLGYDSSGLLASLTLPDGSSVDYVHDSDNNLVSVIYTDGKSENYKYDESGNTGGANYPNLMTGIIDEAGVRYATYRYSGLLPVSSENAGGVNAMQSSISANYSTNTNTFTGPLGQKASFTWALVNEIPRTTSITYSCDGCTARKVLFSYGGSGDLQQKTDRVGIATNYSYDSIGDGLRVKEIDASGTTSQRTINTSWDHSLREPTLRSVQNSSGETVSKTQWIYNARGQVLAKCDIDDAQASSYTCAATGTPPAGVRRWTYTYCDAVDTTQCPLVGLTLSATGPRTDLTQTTTYSYYLDSATTGCTTPGGACHQPGDLHTVTDALGHVTSIDSYDADGRVTRTTDPNGVHTDLTYTPRGWLASRSVGGATTSFTYTPYGAVASITDPDGVTTSYTYDDAHRLTDITDAQGNSIHYTLDAAGDKTQEQVLDSTGTALRTTSRTFNTLGELTSVVDGLNHTVFNAGFSDSYDADGNLVHSANALGIEKEMGYDALNRLVSVIRNYNGTDTDTANTQSTMAYDAMDRVTGVTDPDNLSTIYTYDGLGDRTSLQSPDTGTSSDTYDAAGNRLTHTDAKGQVDTSTYDALDRLATQQYADSTLDVTYHYDEADAVTGCSGSYPVGRLTRIVKGDTTTTYCYDAHGSVTQKTQNQNGTLASVAYGYTSGDRLQSVTYPDGTEADYAYDSDGRVQSLSLIPPDHTQATALAAVSGISYLPFGPIASYTLGNGQTITRSYDADYRLTDLTSPLLNLHYARDTLGNITAMGSAPGANPASESYGYDPLQRLKAVTESDGSTLESYTYNKTGDRLSKTGSGQATGAYSYAANTHHLIEVGTAPYSVDADGETTSMQRAGTTYSFTYNARQRMATAQEGAGTPVAYTYNALGERIRKTANSIVTDRFQYDEASHLLSRSRTDGTRDYIWLGSLPVAVVDQSAANGASTESYVVADDLGSPRVVTDASGNQIWSWAKQGNPFGEQQPTSGSGFVFNLRFPGQYYDQEAGLAYNLNRTYEATIGRYIESDPTGLVGGVNTYSYVGGGPFSYTDSRGLQSAPIPGSTVDIRTAMLLGDYAYANQGSPIAPSGASLPDPNVERNMSIAAHGYLSLFAGVMGGELLGALACPETTLATEEVTGSSLQGFRLSQQLSAEQAAGVRAPTRIESWSNHVLKQIAGRDGGIGIQRSALEDAFENPYEIRYASSKYGPTFQYVGRNATIIVNSEGNVVTGWATNSAGTRL